MPEPAEAAIARRSGMDEEGKARIREDFRKDDLYTQCPKCKMRLRGDLDTIMGHTCATSD